MKPKLLLSISVSLWVVGLGTIIAINQNVGVFIWLVGLVVATLSLIVALISKPTSYTLAVFALLVGTFQLLSGVVIGGFISATSMHIIDADEEFYEEQFLRHTDITVPGSAEIVCKQDTVKILGIDGDHYDGFVKYRMSENDLSNIH